MPRNNNSQTIGLTFGLPNSADYAYLKNIPSLRGA